MKVLIVIDMQKDFINGALGTDEAQAIVSRVVKRIKESDNELVLFTKDTHQDDYLETSEGKKLPVPHCIEGTDGWQLLPEIFEAWQNNKSTTIAPELYENTFKKTVFGSTDLVNFLKNKADKICEIELLGVCTDICVVSNAIMIKNAMPDVKISVLSDCCAGVTPESHDAALKVMQMCHIDVV